MGLFFDLSQEQSRDLTQAQSINKNGTNIIVIMTDDLDVVTLNTMLDNDLMPNLQEYVIDRGTEFTNSFVTNPHCCPSRATFLTGQYAHNTGVFTNIDILKLDDEHTLATWLQDDGYNTAIIGKYLNGYGSILSGEYFPPGWNNWQVLVVPFNFMMYDYMINDNGRMIKYGNQSEDYQTDVFSKLASTYIEGLSLDEKPFFLYISTKAPHAEQSQKLPSCKVNPSTLFSIRGPERYNNNTEILHYPISPSFNETDFSDKPELPRKRQPITKAGQICIDSVFSSGIQSMMAVDDLIGNIVHSLENINELDNTVIIFTSDNGFLFGDHSLVGKTYPYENSIRVPLVISSPGFNGSQSSSRLVINNDLAPTILELTGAQADIPMDGRSLIPLLMNPDEEIWRDKFLVQSWDMGSMKYPYKAIRSSTGIYIENQELVKDEFYDFEKDPYQLDNKIDCTEPICLKKINQHQSWLSDLKNCKDGTCQLLENPMNNQN